MISKAKSIQFKKQITGTFNRPIVSLCRSSDGLQTYFLKYPRSDNEFDGLMSEILCHRLAKKLHLNTPEIALVEIGSHPVSTAIIHHEKLKSGQIVFGSKRLEKAEELSQHNFVINKYDFNRLEYPPHILRIGLFDLWIGNKDRKGDNFNLFLTQGKLQKLYIFDHFEAFAKITENDQNEISANVDIYEGFLGYSYAYEMLGWVDKDDLEHEMNEFLNSIRSFDVKEVLDSVVNDLPNRWNIADKTIDYMARFLKSEDRIHLIEAEAQSFLEYLPSK